MFKSIIKQVRLSHDETQERMAERLDVSQRTVASWESGDRMPSIDILIQIAKTYRISTDMMLGVHLSEADSASTFYQNAIESNASLRALLEAGVQLSQDDLGILVSLAKRLAKAK